MRSYVVFSTMGQDRPGLVKEIAEFFTARGINIERSRGCVLGNEFGMIILTSVKTDDLEGFIGELDSLKEKTGLDINVHKTKAPSHREVQPSIPYKLIATTLDRPGIVHQICKVLYVKGINIDDNPVVSLISQENPGNTGKRSMNHNHMISHIVFIALRDRLVR